MAADNRGTNIFFIRIMDYLQSSPNGALGKGVFMIKNNFNYNIKVTTPCRPKQCG